MQIIFLTQIRQQYRIGEMMKMIIVSVVCSVITSVITTKILATHYFEIVDGYVKNMTSKTQEFVDKIKHKLQ